MKQLIIIHVIWFNLVGYRLITNNDWMRQKENINSIQRLGHVMTISINQEFGCELHSTQTISSTSNWYYVKDPKAMKISFDLLNIQCIYTYRYK